MRHFEIPYGEGTLPLMVPEKNLAGVIKPEKVSFDGLDEAAKVQYALEHPIGSPRLRDLAFGKHQIVIVTSDHTRSVPSRITLPLLLREIRRGAPDADIKLLIAAGLHRATTKAEQRRMFGDEIVDNEQIYVHDANKEEEMTEIGTLPSGAVCKVNRMVVECELLITEGFIEPHFFAGYSGGRKSILPGVSARETIIVNHSYQALSSPYAAAGILEKNPIHEDMIAAAKFVNAGFILNVALDENKHMIGAFAGDMEEAHTAGCGFIRSFSLCNVVEGDIVVTSNGGSPLDRELYQGPKAVSAAELCAGEDGIIILASSCTEGFGGSYFGELMRMGSPQEIDAYLSGIAPEKTIPEQWSGQVFSRVMRKHQVILVTDGISEADIRAANFIPAGNLKEAMEKAFEIKGQDARVVVIPDGVAVLFH